MLNHLKSKMAWCGLSLTMLAGGCASDSSNAPAPLPDAKMVKASGHSLDTLGRGYSKYQIHCAQCHELMMPKDMRTSEWHTIVPGMAWNAGLEKKDEEAILAYLVAATKRVRDME